MTTPRVLVIVACFGFIGGAAMLYGAPGDEDSKAVLERQLNELRTARVASARKALEGVEAAIQAQEATVAKLADVTRNLLDAELDMATKPEEEIAAWEKYILVAMQLEERCKALSELGTRGGEASEYYTAKQEHQRAEIELLKVRIKSQ